jgi:hypothetical protein
MCRAPNGASASAARGLPDRLLSGRKVLIWQTEVNDRGAPVTEPARRRSRSTPAGVFRPDRGPALSRALRRAPRLAAAERTDSSTRRRPSPASRPCLRCLSRPLYPSRTAGSLAREECGLTFRSADYRPDPQADRRTMTPRCRRIHLSPRIRHQDRPAGQHLLQQQVLCLDSTVMAAA